MRALPVATAALFLVAAHAAAADIDLSRPWGDRDGCINRNGQEVASDHMLLLTATDLVTAASACTITGKKPGPNGSLLLTADCEAEGEDQPSASTFNVTHSKKNPKKLVVIDGDGFVYGEVAQCK